MTSSRRFLSAFLLLAAVPAMAHDCEHDCQPMSPEARAEFERARMVSKLDCAGLQGYVEQQRWLMNQRTIYEYNRALSRMTTAPAPHPTPSPTPAR